MQTTRCLVEFRLGAATSSLSALQCRSIRRFAVNPRLHERMSSVYGREPSCHRRSTTAEAASDRLPSGSNGSGSEANGTSWGVPSNRTVTNGQLLSPAAANQAASASSLIDCNLARKYGLNETLLRNIMDMPSSQSKSMEQMVGRVKALGEWKACLQRGVLPEAGAISWPQEPLSSTLAAVLSDLEMPRFCRRFPTLLSTVLNQMIGLIGQYEDEMNSLEEQAEQEADQQPESEQQQQQQQQPGEGGTPQEASADGQLAEDQPPDGEPQQGNGAEPPEQGQQQELQLSMSSQEQQQLQQQQQQQQQRNEQRQQELQDKLKAKAEELTEQFKQEWQPVAENLDRAMKAFDNLDGLMERQGFDLSQGIWQNSGWQEVEALRKKLETLTELRELVRSLGRAGARGPLRRAPEQILASTKMLGVIRSSLQPEETRGLTRSGDLSRMLPIEAHLMVAARRKNAEGEKAKAAKAAHRLHLVRRAERNLMSYDRTGWLEDEPSKLTGRFEIRPAAEQGPIIVCLDTSGSMGGARETVAKAAALECMRSAHRNGRRCYLYAFSGPCQVQEMELGLDERSMVNLLNFLQYSFGGGTDVDRPLELSLKRLEDENWAQADILMVTDGEICPPDDDIIQRLNHACEEMGLRVHGLLVGRDDGGSEAMKTICTHLHQFQSWSVVGGGGSWY